ncbi:MAG TPA: hypothetical protein VJJ46_08165 [Anaerolineales bacterium]|nr:hypothetical protein [Anaerolineales bacterium]
MDRAGPQQQPPLPGPAGEMVPPSVGRGLRLVGRASGVGLSAGCLTAFLTLTALFAGIALDRLADTQPMFTLTFVLGSIPISLIAMVWWVLRRARRIALDQPDDGRAKEH